jgi:hypothetical protein
MFWYFKIELFTLQKKIKYITHVVFFGQARVMNMTRIGVDRA